MGNRILVIGSSGKTGKRVFSRLRQLNIDAVPASRSSAVPFDWYDQSTWEKALHNIDKAYITFQPDLAIPEALNIVTAFVKLAVKSGLKKLVLLSGRGEVEAQACENVIIASGLDYTILRCSFFMQNFSEGIWLDAITSGEFVIPGVTAKEPFVDVDDIAEVAVKSLLEDKHNGKVYELTGPELLSFGDAVSKISSGSGQEVKFAEVELSEYSAMLRSDQVPEEVISLISYLFSQVLDGRNESVQGAIPTVLGRPATSFQQYVAKTVSRGIWKASASIG